MKENEFKDGRNIEPLEKTMLIIKPKKNKTREVKETKANG